MKDAKPSFSTLSNVSLEPLIILIPDWTTYLKIKYPDTMTSTFQKSSKLIPDSEKKTA